MRPVVFAVLILLASFGFPAYVDCSTCASGCWGCPQMEEGPGFGSVPQSPLKFSFNLSLAGGLYVELPRIALDWDYEKVGVGKEADCTRMFCDTTQLVQSALVFSDSLNAGESKNYRVFSMVDHYSSKTLDAMKEYSTRGVALNDFSLLNAYWSERVAADLTFRPDLAGGFSCGLKELKVSKGSTGKVEAVFTKLLDPEADRLCRTVPLLHLPLDVPLVQFARSRGKAHDAGFSLNSPSPSTVVFTTSKGSQVSLGSYYKENATYPRAFASLLQGSPSSAAATVLTVQSSSGTHVGALVFPESPPGVLTVTPNASTVPLEDSLEGYPAKSANTFYTNASSLSLSSNVSAIVSGRLKTHTPTGGELRELKRKQTVDLCASMEAPVGTYYRVGYFGGRDCASQGYKSLLPKGSVSALSDFYQLLRACSLDSAGACDSIRQGFSLDAVLQSGELHVSYNLAKLAGDAIPGTTGGTEAKPGNNGSASPPPLPSYSVPAPATTGCSGTTSSCNLKVGNALSFVDKVDFQYSDVSRLSFDERLNAGFANLKLSPGAQRVPRDALMLIDNTSATDQYQGSGLKVITRATKVDTTLGVFGLNYGYGDWAYIELQGAGGTGIAVDGVRGAAGSHSYQSKLNDKGQIGLKVFNGPNGTDGILGWFVQYDPATPGSAPTALQLESFAQDPVMRLVIRDVPFYDLAEKVNIGGRGNGKVQWLHQDALNSKGNKWGSFLLNSPNPDSFNLSYTAVGEGEREIFGIDSSGKLSIDSSTSGLHVSSKHQDKVLLRGSNSEPNTILWDNGRGLRLWDVAKGEVATFTGDGDLKVRNKISAASAEFDSFSVKNLQFKSLKIDGVHQDKLIFSGNHPGQPNTIIWDNGQGVRFWDASRGEVFGVSSGGTAYVKNGAFRVENNHQDKIILSGSHPGVPNTIIWDNGGGLRLWDVLKGEVASFSSNGDLRVKNLVSANSAEFARASIKDLAVQKDHQDKILFRGNHPGQPNTIVWDNGQGVRFWDSRNGEVATFTAGGDLRVRNKIYAGGSAVGDVAEHVVGVGLEAGDVVVSDGFASSGSLKVARSTDAFDSRVVGVISSNPSITLARAENALPLAVSGIVPVKVDASFGEVREGDLLTSSSTPGHARVCPSNDECFGAVIGKALEGLADGKGVVKAIVLLS